MLEIVGPQAPSPAASAKGRARRLSRMRVRRVARSSRKSKTAAFGGSVRQLRQLAESPDSRDPVRPYVDFGLAKPRLEQGPVDTEELAALRAFGDIHHEEMVPLFGASPPAATHRKPRVAAADGIQFKDDGVESLRVEGVPLVVVGRDSDLVSASVPPMSAPAGRPLTTSGSPRLLQTERVPCGVPPTAGATSRRTRVPRRHRRRYRRLPGEGQGRSGAGR